MVPLVSFGKTYQQDGKTLLGGQASQYNTGEIVDNLVKAKEIPVDIIKAGIEKNDLKKAAYIKLNTLLKNFQTVANNLRQAPGTSTTGSSVFDSVISTLTTNNSSPANTFLSVSTSEKAQAGQFTIDSIVTATAAKQYVQGFSANNVSVVASSPTEGMFTAGTFQINGKDITINEGDTLLNIQQKLNFSSSRTNVSASIMKLSPSNFQLTLTSTNPGTANAFTITDPDNVFDSNGDVNWTRNPAGDASFNIDGQPFTSSSNKVEGIIEGITFNLIRNSPDGTSIYLDTQIDKNKILTSIAEFADSYNEILSFVAKQQRRDPKTHLYLKDAVLGNENTLRIIKDSLAKYMLSSVNGISTKDNSDKNDTKNYITIREVGIKSIDNPGDETTPPIKNWLQINHSELSANLDNNFLAVRKVFEASYSSSNIDFGIYKTSNNIQVSRFSINLDNTLSPGWQATVTYKNPITHKHSTVNANYGYKCKIIPNKYQPLDGGDLGIYTDTDKNGITNLYCKSRNRNPIVLSSTDTNKSGISPALYNKILSAVESSTPYIFSGADNTEILTFTAAASYTENPNSPIQTIFGLSGTVLDGLELLYTGSGIDTVDIDLTLGVAEKIHNDISFIINPTSGLIETEEKQLSSDNDNKQSRVDTLNKRIETFRKNKIKEFAKLEVAISKAHALQQFIDANYNERQKS